MYDTLHGSNPFLMQLDLERQQAHRGEIKRALAEISVKKSSISDLQNIVAKLSGDSETAADEHSEAASKLQAELDELDREQIENVMANVTMTPKSLLRRRLILDELNSLNQTLELRCEANKRAARPVEKQIRDLTMETTAEGALRNQLTSLCSPATRQKKMLAELKLQLATSGLREAQRIASTIEHNREICELNRNATGAAIQSVRLADAESLVSAMKSEITALHAEAERLQQLALDE